MQCNIKDIIKDMQGESIFRKLAAHVPISSIQSAEVEKWQRKVAYFQDGRTLTNQEIDRIKSDTLICLGISEQTPERSVANQST